VQIQTVLDIYEHHLDYLGEKSSFSYTDGKGWKSLTGNQFREMGRKLAAYLAELGVSKGDKVLIISHNRPEWHLADYAIQSLGAITVPAYPTLTAKDTAFIAVHAEAKAAVVSSPMIAEKLSEGKKWVGDLSEVVVMEHSGAPHEALFYFDEALRKGAALIAEKKTASEGSKPGPGDIASIIYTSGTTGEPKGVMLTHDNFVKNARASLDRYQFNQGDSALVFLPLAHSFERLACYAYMWEGLKISYAESIDRLLSNLRDVQPTIMCAVPRFYERIYSRLMENASRSSYPKKVFIHFGVNVAEKWAKAKVLENKRSFFLSLAKAFFNLTFYRGLRKRMGGRIRFFVSGGAPLNPDLEAFFYGAGLKIVQGYGLTETSPVLTANCVKDMYFGSVGVALGNVEIKIDADGEILARGPNIMKGYFKNDTATKEVLSEDGWFKTGDIGHLDDKNRLFITDRKKELIVTAGGKNVAPQHLESVLAENKYVNQAIVIGDALPYLSALIHPNWENVKAYAERKDVRFSTIEELSAHPQIEHLFDNVLKRANAKLSRFEQLKAVQLLIKELTVEGGELTPTLKVKRRVVFAKYKSLIDSMYEGGRGGLGREKRPGK
jgi:long-chain acyl-CoA synthetase